MSDNTGLVERLSELRQFLGGAGNIDGSWFGDTKQRRGMKIAFWWRVHLVRIDEAIDALQSSEARALTAAGETLRLREALAACLEQNVACFWHHYGHEEEPVEPQYIQEARSLLSTPLVVGGDQGNQRLTASSAQSERDGLVATTVTHNHSERG